ncbi:efflux transporter outer membrane subunit [Shewanella sp. MMG014]|uniref:efflux transporter outer membrane subunit n=1 Tax=Shewanella sp. MMG014 TaxID=2822691 RepID=UPI001FFD2926|nr:efflux transporter outer membrane subunit [Shewanella sp. MMG014]
MKMRNISLVIALLLGGCSMTPDYQAPETVGLDHVYLHADNTQQIETDMWWNNFSDPQLDRLVEEVQQQNISIQIAAERITAAQSYESMVSSLKIPTVNLGAGAVDYRLSENDSLSGPAIGAQVIDKDHQALMVGANVSWEIDLFGRLDALSDAANIRVQQAEILSQGVNTLITADVVHNYLQYRGAQARLAIAQRNIHEQQQTLEMVQTLVNSGFGSELDLASARAALATVSASQTLFETAEKVHLYRLATLLGQHPSDIINRFEDAPLPTVTGQIPTGMPSDILKRRTDIALAEREMAAINAELGASIANQYPQFYLTASPAVIADSADDLFSSTSVGWAAGLGAKWTVFDGGRSSAMVDMQQTRFKQASLRYEQAVNAAFNEVETTLMSYGNSLRFYQQLETAAQQTQTAVAKANSLYKAGLIDYIQVLDAQRQDNTMQDALVTAQLNIASNVILVNKALGGDWKVKPSTDDNTQKDTATGKQSILTD